MSTETAANADAANAAVDPIKPAPTNAQANEDPNKEPNELPAWVAKRVEQAKRAGAKDAEAVVRKAMLAELGVDDPAKIKQIVDEQRKREEAQKSQEQKLAELTVREQQREARLKELEETVKLDASEQLAALTEDQRKAVLDLAGEDPAKQRKAIATLRPTWAPAAPATPPIVPATNASQAPVVAPTKPAPPTAPGNVAPTPAGTQVVANHLQVYEQLLASSPFVAADYYQAHYAAINEARGARS
jgi:hypothetical protein